MDLGISSNSAKRRSGFESSVTPSTKVDESGNIKKAFSVEELQGVNKNIDAPGNVDSASKISTLKPVTKTDATQTAVRETIARPISRADIVDQLVQLHKSPTPDNVQIVSTILQYGLEASVQNFETIQTLTKGRKTANSLESSVISLSKGLAETPRSVDIIGHFLNKQIQINQQLQQLQSAMSQFQLAMNWSSKLMDSGLLAGLGAIVSELDDSLKKLNKSTGDRLDWSKTPRGELISDFKALYEFIGGLQQKLATGDAAALDRFMKASTQLQSGISGFLESLTSQAIMSEQSGQTVGTDRFGYWQFPNPWMANQSPIELLVRKDPLKKQSEYNTQKTRMIIKLETPDLGEVAVTLDVLDQKIWMMVHSDKPETRQTVVKWIAEFKSQLQAQNYELVSIQTSEKKVDIRQLLLPQLNLDNLSRISTEV
jgi:hypothetical protein